MIKEDVEKIQKILVLYYFGAPVVTEEDKKVDGIVCRAPNGQVIKHKVTKEPALTGTALNPYTFMLTLLKLAREASLITNPTDINVLRSCYLENRSRFQWPRDDREATAVLTDFFNEANFVRRLQLHQQHINKSKTKQKSLLTLYFMELSDHNKVMNLLA